MALKGALIREIIPFDAVSDIPNIYFYRVIEKDADGKLLEKYLMIKLKEDDKSISIELSVLFNQKELEELIKGLNFLWNEILEYLNRKKSPLFDPQFDKSHKTSFLIMKDLDIAISFEPIDKTKQVELKVGPLDREYSKLKLSERIKLTLPLTVYNNLETYQLSVFIMRIEKTYKEIFNTN